MDINKIDIKAVVIICIFAVVFISYFYLGFTAIKSIVAISLLWIVPFYLILVVFGFKEEDSFFYSFFIGIGLVSYLVYFINPITNSLGDSIVIAMLVLYAIPLIIYITKKKFMKNKLEINK